MWNDCPEGYGGIVCGVCWEGWQQSTDFLCTKCPEAKTNLLRSAGTIAGLLVGAFVLRALAKVAARCVAKVLAAPQRSVAEEGSGTTAADKHAKKKSRFLMKLKILVGTMQILSQVVNQLGSQIKWPAEFRALVATLSIPVNLSILDVANLGCFKSYNFYGTLLYRSIVTPARPLASPTTTTLHSRFPNEHMA